MTMQQYKIRDLVVREMQNRPFDVSGYFFNPLFFNYYKSLLNLVNYSLPVAREVVKLVCRTAFGDSELTENEAIVLILVCTGVDLDNILMEVNYNANW